MDYLLSVVDPKAVLISVVLMGLDIVFGLCAAFKDGDYQSSRMRQGLWHKAGSIGLIVVAYALEYAVNILELDVTIPGVLAVCAYIALMEAGSCLENLVLLNPDLADNPVMRAFAPKHKGKNDDQTAAA